MSIHLFTYGSLMFEPVWSRLVQGHYRQQPARLYGYVRKQIRHETYPALLPADESCFVDGIIYLGIDAGDLQAIDAFEGAQYLRQQVTCQLPNRSHLQAQTYVFHPTLQELVTDQDWDPAGFETRGLQEFLRSYTGLR
jgi:gamma-glutamylcyclotransferase (GGCT)/AIG2-like uncharacterized protein YtfP